LKVSITGKHLDVRGGMKSYINERLEKLRRFFEAVDTAHVVLKTEKYLNTAEISLNGKKLHLYAEGSSEENLYVAIDRAVDRIEIQIKKQTEKIKGHSVRKSRLKGKISETSAELLVTPIERESFDPKPKTEDEAKLELDSEERNFLVFKNARTKQINVIYDKKNGRYGLIEP